MTDELMVEIVTPEKMVFSGKIEEVTIPGGDGEFGVLIGHAPLLSTVDIGVLNYTKDGKKIYYAVGAGYAEVTLDKVTVLIESAERADTIDKEKVKELKELAEQKLSGISKDDPDYETAKAALENAENTLKVAERV
ncbi:MAG: F0F1 ATP synthase subunit epsilon [Syntrophobacterales bacterium]|nr:F0F1 ATP synthase subunit epsilon [Syntrophobacterales bacterium]